MSTYLDNTVRDRIKALLLNEHLGDVHFPVVIDDIKVSNCMLFYR